MSKTLVIGASGVLGSRIVEALGEDDCIQASRNAGERVDLSDPELLVALFARVGPLDGIVCAAGAARYKPWDALTDDDWAFSLANKLMGQINVVRFGAKKRPGGRRDHADVGPRGATPVARGGDPHHRERGG